VARLFERYVRGLAAKHFAAVHWGGAIPESPGAPGGSAILFVANHTNWWDGFLACLVSGRLELPFHILMDATQLERYRLFRRVGALPMHRESPVRGYADLARAATVLRRPRSSLWIFPQGARRPPGEAIRGTERGAAQLALDTGVPVRIQPVGFRYAYLGEQIPEAFVWFGPSFSVEPTASTGPARRTARRALADTIESRLRDGLTELDHQLAGEVMDQFRVLVQGRRSVNKRLDRVRHALGLLRGPFDERNG
jgi:1-acyl-sn-glycerol-3-phosphate acyltransferase